MGHGQTQGRLLGADGLGQTPWLLGQGIWSTDGHGWLQGLPGRLLAPCQKSRKVVGSGQELEEKFRSVDTRASQIVVKD